MKGEIRQNSVTISPLPPHTEKRLRPTEVEAVEKLREVGAKACVHFPSCSTRQVAEAGSFPWLEY